MRGGLGLVKAIWQLISFFLALGAFIAVAVDQLICNEDLFWLVVKAIGAFFASWLLLGFLGGLLELVLEGDHSN
jgi:hypothetical protein